MDPKWVDKKFKGLVSDLHGAFLDEYDQFEEFSGLLADEEGWGWEPEEAEEFMKVLKKNLFIAVAKTVEEFNWDKYGA